MIPVCNVPAIASLTGFTGCRRPEVGGFPAPEFKGRSRIGGGYVQLCLLLSASLGFMARVVVKRSLTDKSRLRGTLAASACEPFHLQFSPLLLMPLDCTLGVSDRKPAFE